MIESIRLFIAELRSLWGKIGLNQKIALGLLAVVFVGALLFWGSWNRTDDYGLLFKNLQEKDAGEIVNGLKGDGIPHRIEDNGTTILVPSDRVYDLRLQLASQGLPRQEEGWELFDRNRLGGLSDFLLQVNHTRALQAELERSISRLRQIEWARVHIVQAKDSLFIDKTEPASASVLIKTRAGARLTDSEVAGICYLIAGAVRGLTPDNVTVADYSGRQLSKRAGSDVATLAANQLEYRRQIEQHLSTRATEMLERVLGPGRGVVTVSAEVDFSTSENHEVSYRDQITKSTSETVTETTSSSVAGEAGVQANVAGAGVGGPMVTSTREETTEYMPPVLSSETKRIEPGGKIKRLAAAVFVSAGEYRTRTGEGGEEIRTYVPASGADLAKYEQTVKNAVAYVEGRDSLTISDVEFKDTAAVPAEEIELVQKENTRQFIVSLVKSGSTAFGVLLFLIFARHMLKKAFAASGTIEPASETVGMLERASAAEELQRPEETPTLPLKEEVAAAVNEDPNRATQYLKMWMSK